eukprot:914888-Alexandrium_andersonii.AAC.1
MLSTCWVPMTSKTTWTTAITMGVALMLHMVCVCNENWAKQDRIRLRRGCVGAEWGSNAN